jgi:hypothetical protein
MAPKAHSELGASIAHRWMPCPGSVALTRGMPNYDNIHSITGTAAHSLAEICLSQARHRPQLSDPLFYIGEELDVKQNTLGIDKVEVTEEMAEAVKVYVDYCRTLISEPGALYWPEQQFNLEELGPPEGADMFGTSDFPCYVPATRTLHVVDYKHGSGVVVEVKGNKQLRYYGLGALLKIMREHPELDIDEVQITIVQPRAAHPDGPIRSETLTVLDLLAFSRELMTAAEATQQPDAPLVAGAHCRFCPAAAVCPAQRDQAQALAQVAFADMPVEAPPAPETLPLDVFADMLGKMHILDDWSRAMRQHAQHMLERGEVTPEELGMKLVAKRANRKWVDEKAVIDWLQSPERDYENEEIFKQTLLSPAQIEKLVGKKNLPTDLYEKKSSGVSMVPLSDPRPAVALEAGEVFPALTSGD